MASLFFCLHIFLGVDVMMDMGVFNMFSVMDAITTTNGCR
jgi:hypothetical protein